LRSAFESIIIRVSGEQITSSAVVVFSIGKSNKQKDYNVHGTQAEKVFNALGAVAAIVVCNTSGLLPEIQSTVREPAVRGMRRALLLQYTAGAAGYYGISVAGYWAYGSAVSEYLPNELGGPRWAAVLINATAFLQSIVSQHVRTQDSFFNFTYVRRR
jgi:hypothetical protein